MNMPWKGLAFLTAAVATIAASQVQAASNTKLTSLSRVGDITWYLVMNEDPMAGSKEAKIWGIDGNGYYEDDYIHISCNEARIHISTGRDTVRVAEQRLIW
jgi:hypothetical protein